MTDEERRKIAERNIRRWLNSYLHEEIPQSDARMAAVAAGFDDEGAARSYLRGVLIDIRPEPATDREALLALAEELGSMPDSISIFTKVQPRDAARRIREACGEEES